MLDKLSKNQKVFCTALCEEMAQKENDSITLSEFIVNTCYNPTYAENMLNVLSEFFTYHSDTDEITYKEECELTTASAIVHSLGAGSSKRQREEPSTNEAEQKCEEPTPKRTMKLSDILN